MTKIVVLPDTGPRQSRERMLLDEASPRRQPLVVVQNNFVERLTGPAAKAARDLGIALHDISSGDDVAGRRPLPDGGPWGPILVIGSILFTSQWARGRPDLAAWIDWEDSLYDAALWAERLGERFLNHAGLSTTVGGLIAIAVGPVHVRPRSEMKLVGWHTPDENHAGQKSVAGLVADAAKLQELRIDPAVEVWAAPPRTIDAEVRVWMIDGNPIAASTYRVAGKAVFDASHPLLSDAIAAAEEITNIFRPGKAHVTDVALCDGTWSLIEYNPIHSSGWYAVDPATVISAWFAARS